MLSSLMSESPSISIIPRPMNLAQTRGTFALDARCAIVAENGTRAEAEFLAQKLSAGGELVILDPRDCDPDTPAIRLGLDESLDALGREGYRLTVSPDGITLAAAACPGLFYAIQTLLQLLPAAVFEREHARKLRCELPCVAVEDSPRFTWRGAMLDVSRFFMPKAFVLKFLDLMALHKMNVLHLHLNDDQGWRIEIKKYPKLTSVGAFRDKTLVGRAMQNPGDSAFDASTERFDYAPHGGFYTQDDAREIVVYAAARHITIVPEIEMPGHAQAAIAAYPTLGCTDTAPEVSPRWGIHDTLYNPTEATIQFLQDVLGEIMEIFPGPYIHVGGDEAVKTQWENSALCRETMHSLGLENAQAMQSWFIGRMGRFLSENGRTLIGWDEILEGGLAADAVVMSWRGEEGGIDAAKAGHDVVMAPYTHTYFDYYQTANWEDEPLGFRGLVSLDKVYMYEPVPKELPPRFAHHVLGAQCQLWTEYMPNAKQVEYMAFPRLCALAETVWSDPARKDYDEFLERLKPHLERLEKLDVNYRPLDREAIAQADLVRT